MAAILIFFGITAVSADSVSFEKTIRPFLEKHCVECHQGADPEGDLDLTPHLDEAHARASFDDWMWLLSDDRLLNRAYMTRAGVHVGEVIISFEKQ